MLFGGIKVKRIEAKKEQGKGNDKRQGGLQPAERSDERPAETREREPEEKQKCQQSGNEPEHREVVSLIRLHSR